MEITDRILVCCTRAQAREIAKDPPSYLPGLPESDLEKIEYAFSTNTIVLALRWSEPPYELPVSRTRKFFTQVLPRTVNGIYNRISPPVLPEEGIEQKVLIPVKTYLKPKNPPKKVFYTGQLRQYMESTGAGMTVDNPELVKKTIESEGIANPVRILFPASQFGW